MTIRALVAYASMLLVVAGCAKPAPPPPAPPPVVTNDTSERSFEEAVNVATDALVAQLQRAPAASAKTDAKRGVVIDPMIDSSSGQQTASTQALEQRVGRAAGERRRAARGHAVPDRQRQQGPVSADRDDDADAQQPGRGRLTCSRSTWR
jgi:hypothetical protein